MKNKKKVVSAFLAALALSLGGVGLGAISANAEYGDNGGEVLSQCADTNGDRICDTCGKLVAQSYDKTFDFTSASDMSEVDMFSAGIDPAMASEDWTTHAKAMDEMFTLDNGLKVNTALYGPDGVSENNVYVRYNKQNYKYFKAELKYSYAGDRNGWAGFIMGCTDPTAKVRWPNNPTGIEFFVQTNGKGTYSSHAINGGSFTESDVIAGWDATGEHTLTIIATKAGVSFYVDGMYSITISAELMAEKGYELTSATIGFMFTNATYTAKSFSVSMLEENGNEHTNCVDSNTDHKCDICG